MTQSPRAPQFAVVLLSMLFFKAMFSTCHAHGTLIDPRPRGALSGILLFPRDAPPIDRNAPRDPRIFFPAGIKNNVDGSGKRYQARIGRKFMEFDPTNPSFRWRAGVCGDTIRGANARDHLRGGKYYHKAKIVKTYKQGSHVSFKVAMNVHHKGFFRFHVCNVKNCRNNEISFKCFNKRNCRELKRVPVPKCESRLSPLCGPIPLQYQTRWYVPCENRIGGRKYNIYGLKGEIRYKLPKGFTCEHCVFHFFWTSGNNCKPVGTREYFLSKRGPKNWVHCLKKNGAPKSYTENRKPCFGKTFPEEYYQCADIRIVR